jgi:hypothetical protein
MLLYLQANEALRKGLNSKHIDSCLLFEALAAIRLKWVFGTAAIGLEASGTGRCEQASTDTCGLKAVKAMARVLAC